jgi:hypothetical protein
LNGLVGGWDPRLGVRGHTPNSASGPHPQLSVGGTFPSRSVDGHLEIPVGGHANSSLAAIGAPRPWPRTLPPQARRHLAQDPEHQPAKDACDVRRTRAQARSSPSSGRARTDSPELGVRVSKGAVSRPAPPTRRTGRVPTVPSRGSGSPRGRFRGPHPQLGVPGACAASRSLPTMPGRRWSHAPHEKPGPGRVTAMVACPGPGVEFRSVSGVTPRGAVTGR